MKFDKIIILKNKPTRFISNLIVILSIVVILNDVPVLSSSVSITDLLNSTSQTKSENERKKINFSISKPLLKDPLENTRNDNFELNKLLINENKPFLFQTWVKYFHYSSTSTKPNMFFVNSKFNSDTEKSSILSIQKDEVRKLIFYFFNSNL